MPDQLDAIDLLMDDQRRVLDFFARLMAHEPPAGQLYTVEALCDAIETHLAAEEEILYPAVQPAPVLAHAANRNRASHAMIRAHIQHLREQLRQHLNHEDELRYLMADVERYFEDEASTLLADARRYLPLEVRRRLGREIRRRREVVQPARARRERSWPHVGSAYRRHPAAFLLGAVGVALLAMAGLARRWQRLRVQNWPG